jgi:Cys-tRNA(Pro)/Cys-tRNA(Cys) deacylase
LSGKGTPATAAADAAGISYRMHAYEHDPSSVSDGSLSYGAEAAEALGIAAGRVHKTLVASVERPLRAELVVAVVPVDAQLDLKALALAVGSKRADMANAADAERSSGYVLGGISPLGQRKALTTVIDEDAMLFDTIYVSAGRRGLEIELAADDLLTLTNAIYAPIAKR